MLWWTIFIAFVIGIWEALRFLVVALYHCMQTLPNLAADRGCDTEDYTGAPVHPSYRPGEHSERMQRELAEMRQQQQQLDREAQQRVSDSTNAAFEELDKTLKEHDWQPRNRIVTREELDERQRKLAENLRKSQENPSDGT